MTFPINGYTFFLTLAGSHAHGTASESSDLDLRGVCVAPLSVRLSPFDSFEQIEGSASSISTETFPFQVRELPDPGIQTNARVEWVVFDIAKFVRLCTEANPNALEILFADERDWLLASPLWRHLHDQRHRFLSLRVQQTFVGYAMSQLRRIKTHRGWLLNPPAKKPSREDFGLPVGNATFNADDQNRIEQSIAEKVRSYGIGDIDVPEPTRDAVHERITAFYRDALGTTSDEIDERLRAVASYSLSLPIEVVSTLNAEKRFRSAMKHWEAYQSWLAHRNPARAEFERRFGYDTKHAAHLVRLMRMGVEALASGNLVVRREDATELNAIRAGALAFDELEAEASRLEASMSSAAATSGLPADVDRAHAAQIVRDIVLSHKRAMST